MPPRKVSPSQISSFRECKRRWAWRSVAKIELPSHPSAALGTLVHKQLETVLSGGDLDFTHPSGDLAASALHLLPEANAKGMELEKYFKIQVKDDGILHGYMDIVAEDSKIFPGLAGGAPVVSDHKTTSNLRYAKTPDDLRQDPQGIIYAKAVMEKYASDKADLVWTYISTKGAKRAERTHLRVLSSELEEPYAKILESNSEILGIHTNNIQPLDLEPTVSACDKYPPYGCPYRHLCTDLPVFNRAGDPMADKADMMADLLSKLHGDAPPEVAINPPEYLPPPTHAELNPPPVVKEKKTKAPKASKAPASMTLFVDCDPPPGVDVTRAEILFAQTHARFREKELVPHYRLVDFGKGDGAFVKYFLEVYAENAPTDLVIDSTLPESRLVMAFLYDQANGNVCRGWR